MPRSRRCSRRRFGSGGRPRPLMGVETDREVAAAVAPRARVLAGRWDITSSEDSPEFDGVQAMRSMTDVWFFGFDLRLEGYAKRTGQTIGPDTLEPIMLEIYEYAKRMKPVQFLNAMAVHEYGTPPAGTLLREVRRLAVPDHAEGGGAVGHLQPWRAPT